MISKPVKMLTSLVLRAILSPFIAIPQIVAIGDFLWDDDDTLCFDDGSTIAFAATN